MGVVYLVRHGQASFGAADYDQLSELGVTQAKVLGEALRTRLPRADSVVTGTMARHRQTADACLSALGVAVPHQRMAGFNEYDHEEIIVRHIPRYADKGADDAGPCRDAGPSPGVPGAVHAGGRSLGGCRHDEPITPSPGPPSGSAACAR